MCSVVWVHYRVCEQAGSLTQTLCSFCQLSHVLGIFHGMEVHFVWGCCITTARPSPQQGRANRHYSQQRRRSASSTDVTTAIERVYITVVEAGRVCPQVQQAFGSSMQMMSEVYVQNETKEHLRARLMMVPYCQQIRYWPVRPQKILGWKILLKLKWS